MITTVRPAAARMLVRAANRHAPVRVARPFTTCVRAYKEDERKEAPPEQQSTDVAKTDPRAVGMRAHPAVRLPSLFNEMQRELDAMTRMFGLPSLMDDAMFAPFSRLGAPSSLLNAMPALPSMHLATDIVEDDKAFTIKADCPGMNKEDIKVSVLHGTLTISGERQEEKSEGEEGKAPLRFERSYGSFRRSFSLPPNVDAAGITAAAKDGVLTVTLPKVPEQAPQPTEVPVE